MQKLNFSCETPTPVCLGICVYAEIYAGFNLLAPFFGGDPFLAGE